MTFKTRLALVALFAALCLFSITSATDPCAGKTNIRQLDGTCNNLQNPHWGSAGIPLDVSIEGVLRPQPSNLPNERTLSNKLFKERESKLPPEFTTEERRYGISPDPLSRNMWFAIYGQFIGHDMSKSDGELDPMNWMDNFPIPIEDPDDILYEPPHRTRMLSFPSKVDNATGAGINAGTSFIDAHTVYGWDEATAMKLRTGVGGKLKLREDGHLPDSVPLGLPNACGSGSQSAAGDPRVDENPILYAIHMIWLREHNRKCDELAKKNPSWTDEQLYQAARKWVIALMQHTAYNEFFPTLLGETTFQVGMGPYTGYKPNTNPSLLNVFGSAVDRIPHDIANLPFLYIKYDEQTKTCTYPYGVTQPNYEHISIIVRCIRDYAIYMGVDDMIRSSVAQYAQKFDHLITDGLRTAFASPDPATFPGNFDIETMVTRRGRDHHLPTFDSLRQSYGLPSYYDMYGCTEGDEKDPIECFLLLTNNCTYASKLRDFYGKVGNVEAYVGLVMESDRTESGYPRTAATIFIEQLRRVRDGDRFWFERDGMFTKKELKDIKKTLLSDIVERNSNVKVPKYMFYVPKNTGEHKKLGTCFTGK